MIFHEVYGAYFHCVELILAAALQEELTTTKMEEIVSKNAFSESFLAILPSLKDETWPLLYTDLTTPLQHKPCRPLTTLELRWLKAITLNPKLQLFPFTFTGLEEVAPLFKPEDIVLFDQYADGDPFTAPDYIAIFRCILNAIQNKQALEVTYQNRRDAAVTRKHFPYQLEYSPKDDKFRLLTMGTSDAPILNLGRILSCHPLNEPIPKGTVYIPPPKKLVVLELKNQRNALERVMLHFAHFEKQAEKVDDSNYRLTLYYDILDQTELVIRVLSFGPLLKVIKPHYFIQQVKRRLKNQQERFSADSTLLP